MSFKKDYKLNETNSDSDDNYTISPDEGLSDNSAFGNGDVKRHKSFLENDNINSLKPRRRSRMERESISNIALTDIHVDPQGLVSPPRTASTGQRSRAPSISMCRSPRGSSVHDNGFLNSSILHHNQYENNIPTISLSSAEPVAPITHKRVAPYCFAFDIDGVILKGPTLIPEAKKAVALLNGENKYNIIVPYIFITNGGGTDEQLRANKLTKMLDCEVDEDQVIQGHTPMKSLTSTYQNVLVVGGLGDDCRDIGKKYGFKNVYTVVDIIHWNPSVTPYYKLTEEEEQRALKGVDFSKVNIDCILVMADPRNWVVDQQIILELLMSNKGVMGTHIDIRHDDDPEVIKKKLDETQPDLYFAHSDFVWATDYNLSRYGMGALQVSLAALYREHSNGLELPCKRFGKPQRSTFDFSTKFLEEWRKEVVKDVASTTGRRAPSISNADFLTRQPSISNKSTESTISKLRNNHYILKSENVNLSNAVESDDEAEIDNLSPTATNIAQKFDPMPSSSDDEDDDDSDDVLTVNKHSIKLPPPTTVYFVGDTPESDIRFANLHHESWFSILVETGVYQHGTKPKYEPKVIKKNVAEAVEWVIEREYQKEIAEWKNLAAEQS